MSVRKTDSDSLENTTKAYGIDEYNYSIDTLRKAAFISELSRIQSYPELVEKTVDINLIIDYLNNRVDEITKRYK